MAKKWVKASRRFGETLLADGTQEIPTVEPTLTAERQRVMRIARTQYAAQLLPWKVFTAAVCAGAYVSMQDWSPWGALPWMFAIAVASFLATEWRLAGRHLKTGRIDLGNPQGRRQRRIRRRAVRSAAVGAGVGLWLIAVTLTDISHVGGKLVWLAGAGLWATISYHGWWQLAETAWSSPALLPSDEQPDIELDDEDDPVVPAAPAVPAPRKRRGGVPVAGQTQASTVQVVAEEAPQAPDISLLNTVVETKPLEDEDLTTTIQKVLDDHGLRATVEEAVRAPAVTRYGIKPAPGQRVNAILQRKNDFAMACGSQYIVMQAPIEGRTLVGLEVPNKDRTWVTLGEILSSHKAQRDPDPLLVGLGKNHDGDPLITSIRKMPHFLLGGETGGGKSGGLDDILVSILTRATPDEVRFLLVDVKRVELTRYQGIPHLVMPVITAVAEAAQAFQFVINEMDSRYDHIERATALLGVSIRNIDTLNEKIISGEYKAPADARYVLRPFPYWVVIVDELADLLMLDEGDDVEDAVVRLAQLARAANIHLVLATQNPVVEVLTGRIKANIPSRWAFRTANYHGSKTILDEIGAEDLLGRGDSIIKLSGSRSIRVQAALVTDEEVTAVVKYWRNEATQKGLTVPQIKLATTAHEGKPAASRVTAYDSVLAAAQRLADPISGLVGKDQIRAATPGLSEPARNNALTRLFDEQSLLKVKGQQAVYQVPQPGDKPLETEAEEQQ